jgi:hypothetical protein
MPDPLYTALCDVIVYGSAFAAYWRWGRPRVRRWQDHRARTVRVPRRFTAEEWSNLRISLDAYLAVMAWARDATPLPDDLAGAR